MAIDRITWVNVKMKRQADDVILPMWSPKSLFRKQRPGWRLNWQNTREKHCLKWTITLRSADSFFYRIGQLIHAFEDYVNLFHCPIHVAFRQLTINSWERLHLQRLPKRVPQSSRLEFILNVFPYFSEEYYSPHWYPPFNHVLVLHKFCFPSSSVHRNHIFSCFLYCTQNYRAHEASWYHSIPLTKQSYNLPKLR